MVLRKGQLETWSQEKARRGKQESKERGESCKQRSCSLGLEVVKGWGKCSRTCGT